jgi:hypothetical protein
MLEKLHEHPGLRKIRGVRGARQWTYPITGGCHARIITENAALRDLTGLPTITIPTDFRHRGFTVGATG